MLDYVERETHPEAKAWLEKVTAKNRTNMIAEFERQMNEARHAGRGAGMSSPYAVRTQHAVNYERLLLDLKARIPFPTETMTSTLPENAMLTSPAMEEARVKRKMPFDSDMATVGGSAPPPAKKQHIIVALE